MGRSFILALLSLGFGCSKLTSPPPPEPIASDTPVTVQSAPALPHVTPPPQASAQPTAAGGELKIEDLAPGHGPQVHAGDVVSVQYTGTLLDGTKFDSSRDHKDKDHPNGTPFTTPIPTPGRLIEGWNKGLLGMRVGGRRKLTIPPSLGYGARGMGKIPPNSTLVFDIELVDLKPGSRP